MERGSGTVASSVAPSVTTVGEGDGAGWMSSSPAQGQDAGDGPEGDQHDGGSDQQRLPHGSWVGLARQWRHGGDLHALGHLVQLADQIGLDVEAHVSPPFRVFSEPIAARSAWRARCAVDLTLPREQPRALAISASLRSS